MFKCLYNASQKNVNLSPKAPALRTLQTFVKYLTSLSLGLNLKLDFQDFLSSLDVYATALLFEHDTPNNDTILTGMIRLKAGV